MGVLICFILSLQLRALLRLKLTDFHLRLNHATSMCLHSMTFIFSCNFYILYLICRATSVTIDVFGFSVFGNNVISYQSLSFFPSFPYDILCYCDLVFLCLDHGDSNHGLIYPCLLSCPIADFNFENRVKVSVFFALKY